MNGFDDLLIDRGHWKFHTVTAPILQTVTRYSGPCGSEGHAAEAYVQLTTSGWDTTSQTDSVAFLFNILTANESKHELDDETETLLARFLTNVLDLAANSDKVEAYIPVLNKFIHEKHKYGDCLAVFLIVESPRLRYMADCHKEQVLILLSSDALQKRIPEKLWVCVHYMFRGFLLAAHLIKKVYQSTLKNLYWTRVGENAYAKIAHLP